MTTRRHIVPPVNRLREPFATIVDRVMERDREFFHANPAARSYQRPYIPGELSPDALAALGGTAPPQDAWVIVDQIAPGIRVRRVVRQIEEHAQGKGRVG